MAKEVARFLRTKGGNGGLVTETLIVYELKTHYKAVLYDSRVNGWKKDSNIISSAKFYEKDGDKDLHRVAEYYGFSMKDIRYNCPK